MSDDRTEPIPKPSEAERVAALSALYQAERGDMSTLMGHALNLISIAVAYMVGVAAVWATSAEQIPKWILPLLPFVVWAALGFHAMINANVFAKNVSIENLENSLIPTALPYQFHNQTAVGARAARTVMDLQRTAKDKTRWPFAGSTILSYGGAALIAIFFTIVCIVQSWLSGQAAPAVLGLTFANVYLGILFILVKTWLKIMDIDGPQIRLWNES